MSLKGKLSLYAEIYDKILKLINTGVYPVGSKLPSEVELSKTMKVSRMTLRQSLSLLQEDGYIETIHGQGSFIKDNANIRGFGLEKIGRTVFSCCTEDIDDIDSDFRVNFVNDYDYVKSIFNIDTAMILACNRWYKSKNKVVAHTFSMMPSEVASKHKINLNDTKSLQIMLEEEIYGLAHSSSIEIKHTKSVPPSTNYKFHSKNNLYTLLIEILYDSIGNVILHNKIYIPSELSSIKFNRIY
ncbi:GntR family transcriptional regulator [Paenibacillus sp. GCM10027628]|uniref:GntR family transcriptional regulator n=1 Tax=Paenibacillus sp. GCM10027628 TaxID=3273413 RepID=UPI00363BDCDC